LSAAAALRSRIPRRSEITPVFAACVVPIFTWSIIWFFQELPAWLRYLTTWDILGILAYTQAFALFESASVLIIVTAIAAVLPEPLLRAHFLPQGSAIVLMTAFWAILFQLIFDAVIRSWSPADFALWFGMALVSILLVSVLVHRSEAVENAMTALADRLTVFLYVYIPSGLSGLGIVILRNLW
jgi:hypothetical protein